MESNREESNRCAELAKQYAAKGNYEKARKFMTKAHKLFASDETTSKFTNFCDLYVGHRTKVLHFLFNITKKSIFISVPVVSCKNALHFFDVECISCNKITTKYKLENFQRVFLA